MTFLLTLAALLLVAFILLRHLCRTAAAGPERCPMCGRDGCDGSRSECAERWR